MSAIEPMGVVTIFAILFTVFSTSSILSLGMHLGFNKPSWVDKKNKLIYLLGLSALCLVTGLISICLFVSIGILTGQDHLQAYSDLKPDTVYEVIGEPGSHKGITGRTDDYLFLSENGHEPKAYRFYIAPPYKYFYITDKDKEDKVVIHFNEVLSASKPIKAQ